MIGDNINVLVACVQLRWQIVWAVYCLEVLTARRGRTDVTPHAGVRDQQPPGQGLRREATSVHPDIPVDILHAKVKDMTCLRSGVVTGSKTYSRGLWLCDTLCGSVGLRVNVQGCSLRCNLTCSQCSFFFYILCFVHDNYPFYDLFIHMDFVLIYKMEWFLLAVKVG